MYAVFLKDVYEGAKASHVVQLDTLEIHHF